MSNLSKEDLKAKIQSKRENSKKEQLQIGLKLGQEILDNFEKKNAQLTLTKLSEYEKFLEIPDTKTLPSLAIKNSSFKDVFLILENINAILKHFAAALKFYLAKEDPDKDSSMDYVSKCVFEYFLYILISIMVDSVEMVVKETEGDLLEDFSDEMLSNWSSFVDTTASRIAYALPNNLNALPIYRFAQKCLTKIHELQDILGYHVWSWSSTLSDVSDSGELLQSDEDRAFEKEQKKSSRNSNIIIFSIFAGICLLLYWLTHQSYN